MTIQSLQRDIDVRQAEIDERDEAMKQMQETVTKKGEQNQRLSETVNMIKNQILAEQIFDERFAVQQSTALATYNYSVSLECQ